MYDEDHSSLFWVDMAVKGIVQAAGLVVLYVSVLACMLVITDLSPCYLHNVIWY